MNYKDINYKKILIITLFVIFLGAFLFLSINFFFEKKIEKYLEDEKVYIASLKEIKETKVIYIINAGEGNISEYKIKKISDEITVFSLLKDLSQKENFEIQTTQYDFGIFVESIAEFKGGKDNKYWQYWVNDKLGEVAADRKRVNPGDKIEWRLEVPPEF